MFGKYHIAGVDLGTCNSTITIFRNGVITVVQDPRGNRAIPSMLSFMDDNILYGADAKDNQDFNSTRTIYGIKRILGLPFSSEIVKKEIKNFQFTVCSDVRDHPIIPVNYHDAVQLLRPEGICSRIISYLVRLAESSLQDSITDIVITCPANFNDNQRQATKDAATIAGYNVMEVLNEPTAAAIAYKVNVEKGKTFLVYDLGGGTFDITLMTCEDQSYRVIGTSGDTNLGGMDFDNIMRDIILNKFELCDFHLDLNNKRYNSALWKIAERAKIELSCCNYSIISCFTIGENPEIEICRSEFEDLIRPKIQITIDKINAMLDQVHVPSSDLSEIVLIGGSSQIPLISSMLGQTFGAKISQRINGQEAVSKGALMRALELKCRVDYPETIKDLEAELQHLSPIVPVINAIPLPIGIRTSQDELSIVLKKYSKYGTSNKMVYQTSYDNQQRFVFEVYQGECEVVTKNCMIGKLIVEGIEPAPKGEKRIEVTMSLDHSGILTVSVVNPDNNQSKVVEFLKQSTNLTKEEIEELRRQAQEEKDLLHLEEQRNSAKNYILRITERINQLILDNRFPTTFEEEARSFIEQTESLTPQSDSLFSLEASAKEWNLRLRDLYYSCLLEKLGGRSVVKYKTANQSETPACG